MRSARWLLSSIVLLGAFLAVDISAARAQGPDVDVVIDGVVKKTWSQSELIPKLIDGKNLQGKPRKFVPMSVILSPEVLGVPLEEIALVRIKGVQVEGEGIVALKDALLQHEPDQRNTWKLLAAPPVAKAIKPGSGRGLRIGDVRRVEIVTKAASQKDPQSSK